jgi:hypothetical protein
MAAESRALWNLAHMSPTLRRETSARLVAQSGGRLRTHADAENYYVTESARRARKAVVRKARAGMQPSSAWDSPGSDLRKAW